MKIRHTSRVDLLHINWDLRGISSISAILWWTHTAKKILWTIDSQLLRDVFVLAGSVLDSTEGFLELLYPLLFNNWKYRK